MQNDQLTFFQTTYAVLPHQGEGQVRFYNGLRDPVHMQIPELKIDTTLQSMALFEQLYVKINNSQKFELKYKVGEKSFKDEITIYEKKVTS